MINKFDGKYAFLSNYHPCAVFYEGIEYPSVEHAFQAAKTLDMTQRYEIANIKTPGAASVRAALSIFVQIGKKLKNRLWKIVFVKNSVILSSWQNSLAQATISLLKELLGTISVGAFALVKSAEVTEKIDLVNCL